MKYKALSFRSVLRSLYQCGLQVLYLILQVQLNTSDTVLLARKFNLVLMKKHIVIHCIDAVCTDLRIFVFRFSTSSLLLVVGIDKFIWNPTAMFTWTRCFSWLLYCLFIQHFVLSIFFSWVTLTNEGAPEKTLQSLSWLDFCFNIIPYYCIETLILLCIMNSNVIWHYFPGYFPGHDNS